MHALPSATRRRLGVLAVGGALVLTGCAGSAAGLQAPSAAGATGGAVPVTGSAPSTPSTATPSSSAPTPSVTAPADATDAPAADESEEVPATDPPRPQTTDVVLSYSYWDPATTSVLASGYVSPVIEDDGTCTLVLTRAGNSVTASAPATADASTTSCPELRVPGDQLAAGEWSAVLRYSSGATTGESPQATVAVTP